MWAATAGTGADDDGGMGRDVAVCTLQIVFFPFNVAILCPDVSDKSFFCFVQVTDMAMAANEALHNGKKPSCNV